MISRRFWPKLAKCPFSVSGDRQYVTFCPQARQCRKVTYCLPQAEKSYTVWPECKKSHTICPRQKNPVLSGLSAKSHVRFTPSRKVLYCLAWMRKVTYWLPQAEKSCTIWPECKTSHTVRPKYKSLALSGLSAESHILFAPSRKVPYCFDSIKLIESSLARQRETFGLPVKTTRVLVRRKTCGTKVRRRHWK